jgi:hypothetical protein
MLVIGFTSGVSAVVRANILLIKATSVIGTNCAHFLSTRTGWARAQVERMLGWIAAGFAFAQCVATLAALQIVAKCVITTRAAQGAPGCLRCSDASWAWSGASVSF